MIAIKLSPTYLFIPGFPRSLLNDRNGENDPFYLSRMGFMDEANDGPIDESASNSDLEVDVNWSAQSKQQLILF